MAGIDDLTDRDLDVIEKRLPADAAAVVFLPDGGFTLMCPRMDKDALVPMNILAATEIMLRLTEKDPSVDELAEAFSERMGS